MFIIISPSAVLLIYHVSLQAGGGPLGTVFLNSGAHLPSGELTSLWKTTSIFLKVGVAAMALVIPMGSPEIPGDHHTDHGEKSP